MNEEMLSMDRSRVTGQTCRGMTMTYHLCRQPLWVVAALLATVVHLDTVDNYPKEDKLNKSRVVVI